MTQHGAALKLKEEGNVYFQNGDYPAAEHCYTQAILKDPTNPKFFTNRAMTRLKLKLFDSAMADCLHCLDLSPTDKTFEMKAYYYLAQSQQGLNHPNEAFTSATTAYDLCIAIGDKSIQNARQLVMSAKKAKAKARLLEKARVRSALLDECVRAVKRTEQEELERLRARVSQEGIGEVQLAEERYELQLETQNKIDELQSVFAASDPSLQPRPEIPDHLTDSITFAIMHDPVTTKTGNSYDRLTMIEHLKRSQKDPLTAQPLRMEDLRPNIQLRAACEEFMRENPWAIDEDY